MCGRRLWLSHRRLRSQASVPRAVSSAELEPIASGMPGSCVSFPESRHQGYIFILDMSLDMAGARCCQPDRKCLRCTPAISTWPASKGGVWLPGCRIAEQHRKGGTVLGFRIYSYGGIVPDSSPGPEALCPPLRLCWHLPCLRHSSVPRGLHNDIQGLWRGCQDIIPGISVQEVEAPHIHGTGISVP